MQRSISIAAASGQRIPILARPVDEVGITERAASFTKRSIKKQSKLEALYASISMMDLTTLEGSDTPGKVIQLCRKAINPAPPMLFAEIAKAGNFPPLPSVAAVCVYPMLVPTAVKALRGTKIHVASVATAFPSGQTPLAAKTDDVRFAIEAGASEIDMVINRGAFCA